MSEILLEITIEPPIEIVPGPGNYTALPGPQGIQGEQGIQGPEGAKGDKGEIFWANSSW